MINEHELMASFKAQKPQPVYKEYKKTTLSAWLVTIASQLFLFLGIVLLSFKQSQSSNIGLVLGILFLVAGLQITIYYGIRIKNHRPWKSVLNNTLSLNKRWSLASWMYIISFITPIIAGYLIMSIMNAAVIKILETSSNNSK